ncbi:hypothetical protein ACHAPU_008498 [Fusarium lateritium]
MGSCCSKSEIQAQSNSQVSQPRTVRKATPSSAPSPLPATASGSRTRPSRTTAEYYDEYDCGYYGSYWEPSPHVDNWVSDVASRLARGSIYDTRSEVVGTSHFSSSATGGRTRTRPGSSSDSWTARSRPPTIYEYGGPPPPARYRQSTQPVSRSYHSSTGWEGSTKLGTNRSGDSTQLGENESRSVARSRGPTATTTTSLLEPDEVWVVVDGGKAAEWFSKRRQKRVRVAI